MKKFPSATIDLVANARFACYLPLAVLILGQVAGFLDRQTTNQHPSIAYWGSLSLWNFSYFALPAIGIAWGAIAWKRPAGKLAVAINAIFLIYVFMYPHHVPAGL